MTCCHGVSALRSTVTSPVPVTPLTQMKSASMYLMSNTPLDDAESMPAAIIGKSVLIGGVNQGLIPHGKCSQEGKMNPKEIKVPPESRSPFILGHIPRYERVGYGVRCVA